MWHQIRSRGVNPRLAAPLTAFLVVAAFGMAAPPRPALAASTLRQAAEARGIRMGTALIDTSNLSSNTKYIGVAGGEFDAVTPGNEMKWGVVEPTRGQFNWTGADHIVSFAQAHNQVVRGHTLVWHSQLPNWLTSGGFTGSQVLQLMQQHVATEAGRFAGKVISWDVVNEPFNEDGTLRASIFEQASGGSGYIATALRAARQADPNAKLYLNDFNIEGVNAKSDAMLNLVNSLRQQGVPIDGVGFESHFMLGQVPSSLQQNIQRFVSAGVNVWITELDDRITLPATSANLATQASDYSKVITACLGVTGCVGVTVWGFTDLDSWIPGAFPGQGAADLYDQSINPKPAYGSTLTALGGELLTNADMESGTTGWAVFGSGTLSSTTSVVHSGARSLSITGRTASWNGISQNVSSRLTNGKSYATRVWVRTQSGTPGAKVTLQLTANGSTSFIQLTPATTVNSSGWTLLSGTATVSWSGTLSNAILYVETTSGTNSFFIDDASLA
jgi:endo-1,4-beta-xylanase